MVNITEKIKEYGHYKTLMVLRSNTPQDRGGDAEDAE